jgi:hypothetical protein
MLFCVFFAALRNLKMYIPAEETRQETKAKNKALPTFPEKAR